VKKSTLCTLVIMMKKMDGPEGTVAKVYEANRIIKVSDPFVSGEEPWCTRGGLQNTFAMLPNHIH
jgi:hypothetical protein